MKKEHGPNMMATLVWCTHRLHLLEAVWLHENVVGFDPDFLTCALGCAYIVMTCVFDFHWMGFPVHRMRRLTVGIRRDLMVEIHCPLDQFLESTRRMCECSWRGFLCATEADLEDYHNWMSGRPSAVCNMSDSERLAAFETECGLWPDGTATPSDCMSVAAETRYTFALIPSEIRRLFEYRIRARAKLDQSSNADATDWMVCLVGQEPGPHAQSSCSRVLNTIIRSSSIVWADAQDLKRPIVGREQLAAQGFIVDARYSDNGILSSSFMIDRPRKRMELGSQAGNSMPVPLMGAAILWSLLCIDMKRPVELSSSLSKFLAMRHVLQQQSENTRGRC